VITSSKSAAEMRGSIAVPGPPGLIGLIVLVLPRTDHHAADR
jgi:hypothetical protein